MNDHFADVGKKGTMSLTLALIVLDRLNTTERIDVARDNLAEAIRVVSAAAKKQIPQRVENVQRCYYADDDDTCRGTCPSCGTGFIDFEPERCSRCGQALDWS